ncbi:MAG: hypothetical protein LWW97_07715, partial [Deltaproteobacteria bacterium]|nr:hypothetical protein [Deltaproteobacteria bacterium]
MRAPLGVEKAIERKKIAAYVVSHLPIVKAMFPLIVETVPAKCQAKTLLISLGTVQVNAAIQDN